MHRHGLRVAFVFNCANHFSASSHPCHDEPLQAEAAKLAARAKGLSRAQTPVTLTYSFSVEHDIIKNNYGALNDLVLVDDDELYVTQVSFCGRRIDIRLYHPRVARRLTYMNMSSGRTVSVFFCGPVIHVLSHLGDEAGNCRGVDPARASMSVSYSTFGVHDFLHDGPKVDTRASPIL